MISIALVYGVFLFCLAALFCLYTLNKVPRDVAGIVNAVRTWNTREILAASGVAGFYWTVTALLIYYLIIPDVKAIAFGYTGLVRLFGGLMPPG